MILKNNYVSSFLLLIYKNLIEFISIYVVKFKSNIRFFFNNLICNKKNYLFMLNKKKKVG